MEAGDDQLIECFRRLRKAGKVTRLVVSGILGEQGLTITQFRLLRRIPEEGTTLTQLASRSWIDPGNVSGIVDRLERMQLVTRVRSQNDRRIVLICRTEEGGRVLSRLRPKYRRQVREFMSVLSDDEVERLTSILEKLRKAANAPEETADGKGCS